MNRASNLLLITVMLLFGAIMMLTQQLNEAQTKVTACERAFFDPANYYAKPISTRTQIVAAVDRTTRRDEIEAAAERGGVDPSRLYTCYRYLGEPLTCVQLPNAEPEQGPAWCGDEWSACP